MLLLQAKMNDCMRMAEFSNSGRYLQDAANMSKKRCSSGAIVSLKLLILSLHTMHNCRQQANPLAQESYWTQQTVRQQEQIQLRSCGQVDKGITRWLAHHRRFQHVRVGLNFFTWKQTSSPVNSFLSPNFSEPRVPGVCSLVTLHSAAAVVERLCFALRCR